ncbi:MAG: hypothetical protein JNN24_17330 [Hyphomicrobium zavarzinii]|uniref:hypothetical protein n=1 Tax=Hyphomicrobium TaxID=81 RepID=UPI00037604B8|nr:MULTISPECIES: hypothetical protein [Hyphomicrobium]MBL8847529.1 hypothetical protein [Hyphomicrobium zavarzinii]WBT36259.1 hypothetical protein PE058_11340 [Hyphomicrobium sp. DMF-1]HML42777.1 hypothetical protein [Hyphomicrobium zavarzinii]
MKPQRPGLLSRLIPVLAAPLFLVCATATPSAADPTFEPLIGSWGGSGTYKLQDGTSEKLKCDAYYTGSGSQLGIAVRCSGQTNKIEMRSKLSANGTSLSGNWEERTYNAEGAVTGKLTDTKLSLAIAGSVAGTMTITYDRAKQNVAIATQGIPLKSVTVSLSRK